MAMGNRGRQKQESLFVATNSLAKSPGHPFYEKLNELLSVEGFDEFVESLCAPYYAKRLGRPSIPPGVYFRMLMIGYFEGAGFGTGHRLACVGLVVVAAVPGI